MKRIARLPHFAGVILACGCLIGVLGFGPRRGWAFPHADVERARLGPRPVRARARDPDAALGRRPALRRGDGGSLRRCTGVSVGAVLYALGLAAMAYADTPAMLHLSAGVLIGSGLPAPRSPS